ncbi:hypothetical protein F5050DRAFT_829781 [Lentinula boryana]|uniref:Uncharacterized protein n=1 Tax=Lentinula boryana TaxID=40481 RepID=A0ABQ8Q4V9_9AGAR|nr:hypothetical protein F5050DRAFT_829781 [Lentinula boryana]
MVLAASLLGSSATTTVLTKKVATDICLQGEEISRANNELEKSRNINTTVLELLRRTESGTMDLQSASLQQGVRMRTLEKDLDEFRFNNGGLF